LGEENIAKREKLMSKSPFWVKILLLTVILGIGVWYLPFLWATLCAIVAIVASIFYMRTNPDNLEGKEKMIALLIWVVSLAVLTFFYIYFQILYILNFIGFDLIRDLLIIAITYGFCLVIFYFLGQLSKK
jgi:hypothetical protein